MGRTLKRVPMEFSYPNQVVWYGYLNPVSRGYQAKCHSCKGDGQSDTAKRYYQQWHDSWQYNVSEEDVDALLEVGRLADFTRRPRNDEQRKQLEALKDEWGVSAYWLPETNGYRPSAAEVNVWSRKSIGHDGINALVCVEARCKREGINYDCPVCDGRGFFWLERYWSENDIAFLKEYADENGWLSGDALDRAEDEWQSIEPPSGDGYQLWETTSEGSPVSPVFATLDELCAWAEDGATVFSHEKASKEEWKKMLDRDFVCLEKGNMVFA